MLVDIMNGDTLTITDDENEYIKLVELHDVLNLHDPVLFTESYDQCKTCGAQLERVNGRYQSYLQNTTDGVMRRKTDTDKILMKEIVSRNNAFVIEYGRRYGPIPFLREIVARMEDTNISKQLFIASFYKICEETDAIMANMPRVAREYVNRLRIWRDKIKTQCLERRKTILRRNKAIWSMLKGKTGNEKQQLLKELKEGIKRRKLLKEKEKSATLRYKKMLDTSNK